MPDERDTPTLKAKILPIMAGLLFPKALHELVGMTTAVTASDLDWTYLSPAGLIQPGERTGKFRLGTTKLLTDAKGESNISAEDYAIALVDELENPKNLRQHFTLAY